MCNLNDLKLVFEDLHVTSNHSSSQTTIEEKEKSNSNNCEL